MNADHQHAGSEGVIGGKVSDVQHLQDRLIVVSYLFICNYDIVLLNGENASRLLHLVDLAEGADWPAEIVEVVLNTAIEGDIVAHILLHFDILDGAA